MKLIKNYKTIISILFFSLIPITICFIMCLKDGIRMEDVYLANSKWNDELFYYKMIESVAEFGKPLGYFGYNGSTAKIGQFGPWSPVLFIFYIIHAKLFGWSMMSPIYCNILLMTIAMAFFAYYVQPTRQQALFICWLYSSCTIITRYIFSNLPEVSIYALLVIFLGIAVKVYRQMEFKLSSIHIIALNIIAFLLVLMRPYWVLLFLMPGYFYWQKTRKKVAIFLETILAFISVGIYFFVTNTFCAAYVGNMINTDWLKLLFSSPAEGIYNILYILAFSVWRVLQSVGDGIVHGSFAGSLYALYLTIIGYNVWMMLKPESKKAIWSITTFLMSVMLLAIFYLYDINVGSRHTIGFILMFAFLLPLIACSRKECLLFLICFGWIFCVRATEQYTYQIPERTEEKEMTLLEGYEEMVNAEMLNLAASTPWDNTVIWLYSDETPIDFTYLYALPKGVGINLYFKEYVLACFAELQPKYILTNIGEEVDLLCLQQQKELIAEYGTVRVWKLR